MTPIVDDTIVSASFCLSRGRGRCAKNQFSAIKVYRLVTNGHLRWMTRSRYRHFLPATTAGEFFAIAPDNRVNIKTTRCGNIVTTSHSRTFRVSDTKHSRDKLVHYFRLSRKLSCEWYCSGINDTSCDVGTTVKTALQRQRLDSIAIIMIS